MSHNRRELVRSFPTTIDQVFVCSDDSSHVANRLFQLRVAVRGRGDAVIRHPEEYEQIDNPEYEFARAQVVSTQVLIDRF